MKWEFVFQLSKLREDLERLYEENRRLRSMLDQITKGYSELQSQLLLAMQKQAHGCPGKQVIFFLFSYLYLNPHYITHFK